MTMQHSVRNRLACVAVFLLGLSAACAAQDYPPPYPRPDATRLLANDRVNLWEVYWRKNKPTPVHRHGFDQYSITLVKGLIRVTLLGKPPGEPHTSDIGAVTFTPAGTVHQEEGLTDIPQHKIMIELKPSPAHPDLHGTPPGKDAAKVFEDKRVVAWDLSWKPGEKISRPAENLDSVTVFLDGGTIHSSGNGTPGDVARKSSEAVYAARGTPAHVEEAVSGSPRAIIVELK